MKTVILSIIMTFSWTASATFAPDVIAEYSYGQYVGDEGAKKVIAKVYENGELLISTQALPDFLQDVIVEEPKTLSIELSQINTDLFRNNVLSLVDAKIVKTTLDAVCMMMPAMYMNFDHLSLSREYDHFTRDFKGNVELVVGPNGCWIPNKTMLEHDWQNRTALSIKQNIQLLVNQYASELL